MQRREPFCQPKHFVLAEIVGTLAENASALLLRFLPKVAASRGGTIRHRWIGVLAAVVPVLFAAKTSGDPQTQTEKLSYAQIGFMRPWTSAIPSTWKRGTSVLFIFRNSFVIPSLSGFSANKKLRIWADSFRLARDSDAIQAHGDIWCRQAYFQDQVLYSWRWASLESRTGCCGRTLRSSSSSGLSGPSGSVTCPRCTMERSIPMAISNPS